MNDDRIEEYILSHMDPEPELLKQMTREANIKLLRSRMISGHIQGRFLKILTSILKPKNILEIGTYTGYSALCMAEGAPDTSTVTTIEKDDEMEHFIRKYIDKSEHGHKVNLKIGDALEIIPEYEDNFFDLVFIDANKRDYYAYYNLVFAKLKQGGVIIADNTLWSGKVVDDSLDRMDNQTQGVLSFNDLIKEDKRIEKVILPLRDGLTLIYKK